jgi:hypothetical protein
MGDDSGRDGGLGEREREGSSLLTTATTPATIDCVGVEGRGASWWSPCPKKRPHRLVAQAALMHAADKRASQQAKQWHSRSRNMRWLRFESDAVIDKREREGGEMWDG